MTTGTSPLGLDRRMVSERDGVWYWLDLGVWRKLKAKPSIDYDYTRRWFNS